MRLFVPGSELAWAASTGLAVGKSLTVTDTTTQLTLVHGEVGSDYRATLATDSSGDLTITLSGGDVFVTASGQARLFIYGGEGSGCQISLFSDQGGDWADQLDDRQRQ